MKNNLFRKDIDPACKYCEHSSALAEAGFLACEKCGVVEENFGCRKFKYNPLKRTPPAEAKLPQFEKSEFEL